MQKLVAEVMETWRHAERVAAEMPPTDPMRGVVLEAADQLQVVFRTLTMAMEGDDQPNGTRSELEERVVQTSDEIADDLRRMHAIERLKVSRRADGERLLELSREARGLSAEIASKVEDQLELAEEAAEREKAGLLPGD